MKPFRKIQPPTPKPHPTQYSLDQKDPIEAGAVILVRIDHLLEKGREDIAALSLWITYGS